MNSQSLHLEANVNNLRRINVFKRRAPDTSFAAFHLVVQFYLSESDQNIF